MSLKKLGEAVGLSYGQVGKLERGDEDLSLARLRQFAKVLRCSPADLLPPEDLEQALPPRRVPLDGAPGFEWFDPNTIGAMAWPIRLLRDGGNAYSPHGCIWFGKDYLLKLQIDPAKCAVIDTRDLSMDPAFPIGSVCLIDELRQKREPQAVYCVEHDGEPLIRRARKQGGRWHLVADNPEAKWDIPWDSAVHLRGRVVWTARFTVT